MAKTVASRKAKGRNFQNQVVQRLKEKFKFSDDDIRAVPASVNGVDIILSAYGKRIFPFSCELKNQEKINIWDAIKQAKENTLPDTNPIVIFKRNNQDAQVVISLDNFLSFFPDMIY